jgi:hypothetical protein
VRILRVRQSHCRFTAKGFETINLFYLPALGFGIETGTLFMMLKAFSLSLVFSRDPNPDRFSEATSHMLQSIPELREKFGTLKEQCIRAIDSGLNNHSRITRMAAVRSVSKFVPSIRQPSSRTLTVLQATHGRQFLHFLTN